MTRRLPTAIVPLGDLLVLSAARAPEHVALAFPDERLTAAELLAAATEWPAGFERSACGRAIASGS